MSEDGREGGERHCRLSPTVTARLPEDRGGHGECAAEGWSGTSGSATESLRLDVRPAEREDTHARAHNIHTQAHTLVSCCNSVVGTGKERTSTPAGHHMSTHLINYPVSHSCAHFLPPNHLFLLLAEFFWDR